ncbi:MAG: low-specificity L-threonine aldolase [Myxococcota bacterium]|nr:low-specificity L-threonine aldolase [Myxococcota bacterium]
MTRSIDLRSDTVTQPGQAMRDAMASAEVGDDVYGEDPTVNRLQDRAAELTGKDGALFVPSGTMANQIAIRAWAQPGDALLAAQDAHLFLYEGGGAAALSGIQVSLLGAEGLFGLEDVKSAIAPDDIHHAKTRLVCLENTHNRSGGRVFPRSEIEAIGEWSHEKGLTLHLDGARVFNASIASGDTVEEISRPFDSVSFCLSKGLGAPVGSLICGSRDFLQKALRIRKLFGGGMRQAGMIAAAGLYALDHNVAKLSADHLKASRLAEGLSQLPGVEVLRSPETNIVVFRTENVQEFYSRSRDRGVLLSLMDAQTLRAVTHMDVDDEEIGSALGILREVDLSLSA